MSDTTATDRCRGVLVGLAAGDRNGGPIRMAVRLAESLLDCGGFGVADILERYLRWWREGAIDTGPVSERALALVAAGMPASEATRLFPKGLTDYYKVWEKKRGRYYHMVARACTVLARQKPHAQ